MPMSSIWRRSVFAVLLLAAGATCTHAAELPRPGDWDLGLQAGYLFGMTNNAQAVTFMPRAGRVVWASASGAPGIVSFGIEGLFTHFHETNSAMELGGGPYLRWRWVRPWLQPYAEVGVGMLYNDLKHFSLSSRVLFSTNGAVGVELPVSDRIGITTGYRFRHISNAGQDRVNPGLNTNIFCAGVTFTY
ncbi:MAG: acyloxyacyl hydrolase [Myxococcales bacterium]|jgi:opacity protein-like surface antigen|nr:acyloxyacyl hydrolase [Myxococcales bacterium]